MSGEYGAVIRVDESNKLFLIRAEMWDEGICNSSQTHMSMQ